MKKATIIYSECEHHEDLENYKADVINLGGIITREEVDTEEEEGLIEANVPDDFGTTVLGSGNYDYIIFLRIKDL